jgi:hypothetical protein
MNLRSFEDAFSDHGGSCRRQCRCGKEYFNPCGTWDWAEGELEKLCNDKESISLSHSVGGVVFEGTYYVEDCNCWHERAKRIMAFLDAHKDEIAAYFVSEKKRLHAEAEAIPAITS